MSQSKEKAEVLYGKMRTSREKLVKQYEANGTIRFDVACGIAVLTVPGDNRNVTTTLPSPVIYTGSSRDSSISITTSTSASSLAYTSFPDYREDGYLMGNRGPLNFDAIKAYNISRGVASGTMADAFKQFASGKVVEVYSNDGVFARGAAIVGDTPCLIRFMGDIIGVWPFVPPALTTNTELAGLVHSLGTVKKETAIVQSRGFFRPSFYRGDADFFTNPVSLWSSADKSFLSTSLFGQNSCIRMWGKDQIIDLNGKEIGISQRSNQMSGFSAIIDLSDSHFASLSSFGAKNAHIYSSSNVSPGILGRNNHFAIRGHFCNGVLVENVQSGSPAKNQASYFGTAIFNRSNNIVFKNVHQTHLNQHIPRSSLGLGWMSDLTMHEYFFAKFQTAKNFSNATGFWQWMKWDNIAVGGTNTYNNGKTTPYPVLRTAAEIQSALSVSAPVAGNIYDALVAAQEAYRASNKNHDDAYIQISEARNKNAVSTPAPRHDVNTFAEMTRTTNLTIANPPNIAGGIYYPDSVSYGFRAGNELEGVGELAVGPATIQSEGVYLIDCSFKVMEASMMEAVSIASDAHGLFKTFNGQALRPFGYSNSRDPAQGIASSSMLFSQAALAELFGRTSVAKLAGPSAPYVDSDLDTAAKAFANTNQTGFTNTYADAKAVSGLYKGNDVLESSLATLSAIAILSNTLPTNAILNGVNNSNMDIGILAWRKSMMNALGAATACHVGLKGGRKGDINYLSSPANTVNDGEIYPWFVSKATSTTVTYKIVKLSGTSGATYTFEMTQNLHSLAVNDSVTISDGSSTGVYTVTGVGLAPTTNNYQSRATNHGVKFTVTSTGSDTALLDAAVSASVSITRLDGTQTPTLIRDKDLDFFASERTNRDRNSVAGGYLACQLPEPSNDLYRFVIELIDTNDENAGIYLKLKKAVSGAAVTYGDCATLLGFSAVGKNSRTSTDEVIYRIVQNLDGQNHVHKGLFGIRFDQIRDCAAIRCKAVEYLQAGLTPEMNLISSKSYMESIGKADSLRPGSHVNDCHGISVNGSENVYIEDFEANELSGLGNMYAIEVQGACNNVSISKVKAIGITAGKVYLGDNTAEDDFSLTNKVGVEHPHSRQHSIGVRVSSNCTNVQVNDVTAENITSPAVELAKAVSLEQNSHVLQSESGINFAVHM